MNIFEDARQLIQIESITGNEEAVSDCLEDKVRSMGLPVRSLPVAPARRNILAGRAGAKVLFCTHTDTVPPYVPFREDELFLYGRGACDTKGISAAMLEAGRRLLGRGIDDFGFLWVVGEETDNIGARKANEIVRCRHLIVGEPTENKLARGHKGALGATLRARGTAAHSAHPERGDSAIHRLLDALARVRILDFGSDPTLGRSTINIGRVEGGIAPNVLAPHASAHVLVRVVTTLEETEALLRHAIEDPGTAEPDPRLELDVSLRMPRAYTAGLAGFEETVVAYGTDVPFLKDVGTPYLIGPGSILDAHTADEKISRHSLLEAADTYTRMVEALLSC